MARHRSDARTAHLLGEMDLTREELRKVIAVLLAEGTKKSEVARAASWNPGYLTDFLDNPEKRPTAKKVEALITALGPFVDASPSGSDLGATLDRLGDRYGLEVSSLVAPTTGPIPASAPNYVSRLDVDRTLELSCEMKGDYAIDGQPMVGISTALLYVESILKRRDHEVVRLNAGSALVPGTYGRESRTGIIGLLAAALTESEDPLDLEFFGVQEEIRAYLAGVERPFALLIDDVNQLESKEVEALKLLLRDWATRRAAGEKPFTEITTWTAMTSHVREARRLSNFQSSYTVLRWFNRDEVHALAAALAPYSVARGVVRSSRWVGSVADSAWTLFAGQPQLTHIFLWDRHLDGESAAGDVLDASPSGSYRRHIDSLARSLTNLVGGENALNLVRSIDANKDAMSPADLSSAEWLGIVDREDDWSCDYYKKHLPKATEVAADDLSPRT